jgi:hypothetical protein
VKDQADAILEQGEETRRYIILVQKKRSLRSLDSVILHQNGEMQMCEDTALRIPPNSNSHMLSGLNQADFKTNEWSRQKNAILDEMKGQLYLKYLTVDDT